jgi:hypothetical protein
MKNQATTLAMSKLGDALRAKFKDPKAAILALGLDENLLTDEARQMSTNNEIARKLNAICARQTSVYALERALRPRIAMDAKIGFDKVFEGVTGKKFKDSKPVIAKRIRDQLTSKLAKDADLDDVEKVIDMLERHETEGGDESVSEAQHRAMEAAAHGESTLGIPEAVAREFVDKDKGKSFDSIADYLRGKNLSEDDIEQVRGMMPTSGATDEPAERKDMAERIKEEEKKGTKANDEPSERQEMAERIKEKEKEGKAKDGKAKDGGITKDELDTTLQAALKAQRKQLDGIRIALDEVRPYVGDLPATLALDSGADVRRHALKMLGVEDAETIHESALGTVLKMQPKAGAKPPQPGRRSGVAMDSEQTKSFNERFPHAARIENV